jgi:hypothetical protein
MPGSRCVHKVCGIVFLSKTLISMDNGCTDKRRKSIDTICHTIAIEPLIPIASSSTMTEPAITAQTIA